MLSVNMLSVRNIRAAHICACPLFQVIKIILAFAFKQLGTPIISIISMSLKNLLPHNAGRLLEVSWLEVV
jgi:hypothetical protein